MDRVVRPRSPRLRSWVGVLVAALVAIHAPAAPGADCNANGVPDSVDIADGVSEDCNANSVPDECESAVLRLGRRGADLLVGSGPRVITGADLDGDGRTDLVVGGVFAGSATVSVLRSEGAGRFADAVGYPVGGRLDGLVLADIDADGDPDVVMASASRLAVLRNEGDGTLAAAELVVAPGGTLAIAAADLDGDGRSEVITTDTSADEVTIWRAAETPPLVRASSHPVGDFPASARVGDVDGDGLLDIVVANKSDHDLTILAGDGAGGVSGTLRVDPGLSRPQAVGAVDLDGDGLDDLIVASSSGVSTLRQSRAGGLLEPRSTSRSGATLATGDVDGDGVPDAIVTAPGSPTVSVLVGDGVGSFAFAEEISLASPVVDVHAGDLDGDGDLDLAAVSAQTRSVTLLWNAEGESLAFAGREVSVGDEPHAGALGDLDLDGDLDVVTANGTTGRVSLFLNEGDGGLRRLPSLVLDGYLSAVALGDLDGDEDTDGVVARYDSGQIQILSNPGGGRLAPGPSHRVGAGPFFVALADLDRDGRIDIVSANEGSNSLSVLIGDGGGGLTVAHYPTGSRPLSIAVVDLDADGALDLVSANESSSSLTVHRGEGDGSFVRTADYPLLAGPTSVVSADLDSDGVVDLVTASQSGRSLEVFRGRGGGVLSSPELLPLDVSPFRIAAVDLDGDGDVDLATVNQTSGSASVLANDGVGGFGPALSYDVGREPREIVAGDLGGDGSPELLCANHDSESLTILDNRTVGSAGADYLLRLCTFADLVAVSRPPATGSRDGRSTKFLVPADPGDPDLLPVLFQNSMRYPLHADFLAAVFPDRFPALDAAAYRELVELRATRRYFAGALTLGDGDGRPELAFEIATSPSPGEMLRPDEVRIVYSALRDAAPFGEPVYAPTGAAAEVARDWVDPGFPVRFGGGATGPDLVVYSTGVGYGRVRILDSRELEEASGTGRLSGRDVLVLEDAPRDMEGVVAAIITAEPQGELSHLAVRAARRGLPNAYRRDAVELLRPYAGRIVRVEVLPSELLVRESTELEALEWWEASRPSLSRLPTLDPGYDFMPSLDDLPLAGGEPPPASRFGGKGTNLARLQRVLTGPLEGYREPGFVIPVHYYLRFLRSGQIPSLVRPAELVTYEEFIDEVLGEPRFLTDSEFRYAVLEYLRDDMRQNGHVESELVGAIVERIREEFGGSGTMVRFRSSSNVEDLVEFNGAGLYESTSACADDDLDVGSAGPSRCDPLQLKERGIRRALRKVWASLWTFRAFEERAFYGIPQDGSAMAILVSRAFLDERANGVIFTGNPTNPDDPRYVVLVQPGEASVVSPEPGVRAEKHLLDVRDGEVVEMLQAATSSLVEPGARVLSDERLRELGELMAHVDATLDVDLGDHERDEILLDAEFKLTADGEIAVKQVRPFLLQGDGSPRPEFELEVVPGLTACGVFRVDRGEPVEEYELKATVELEDGVHALPSGEGVFSGALFRRVLLGPAAEEAVPEGPGQWRVRELATVGGLTTWRFSFGQHFSRAGGGDLSLTLDVLDFRARGSVPVDLRRVLDESVLTSSVRTSDDPLHDPIRLEGVLAGAGGDGEVEYLTFASCAMRELPRWDIRVTIDDGSTLELVERHLPSRNRRDTGPAALVLARLTVGGERREVAVYHDLVYAAFRHNTSVGYGVALEPPIEWPGAARPVRFVEVAAPEPPSRPRAFVTLRDRDLAVISRPGVAEFERSEGAASPGVPFQRGDVDDDGAVGIADAITVLGYLFLGRDEPGCRSAADADDDGRLTLTDAVGILGHLFLGSGPLPPPFGSCGLDPTPSTDGKDCDVLVSCS